MAQLLTQYSSHANMIADTVRAAFVTSKVGDCVVEVTVPEGSTLGGKLALQHVTLRPSDGSTALVVGSLNAGAKHAEIRSFAEVAQVHETRLKRPAAFDADMYRSFTRDLGDVLGAFGIVATVAEDSPRSAPGTPTHLGAAPAPPLEEPIEIPTYPAYGKIAVVTVLAAMSLFAGVTWLWLGE